MPQLTPFYFTSEVITTFIILSIIIVFLSQYKLPNIIRLHLSRIYILYILPKNK